MIESLCYLSALGSGNLGLKPKIPSPKKLFMFSFTSTSFAVTKFICALGCPNYPYYSRDTISETKSPYISP